MPSGSDQRTAATPCVCQWVNQADALEHFVLHDGPTQSQQHIKPLHWYVACRLVLEGGFHPDELKPRPPFTVTRRRGQYFLRFDPGAATGSEATVLGGLKTKNVDVVIGKDGLGPVLAVSCKGMTGAFRNLTNRRKSGVAPFSWTVHRLAFNRRIGSSSRSGRGIGNRDGSGAGAGDTTLRCTRRWPGTLRPGSRTGGGRGARIRAWRRSSRPSRCHGSRRPSPSRRDRVPSRGVRAWRPSRYPAGRAGRLRLPRRAA